MYQINLNLLYLNDSISYKIYSHYYYLLIILIIQYK